jgi:signal peptidase I
MTRWLKNNRGFLIFLLGFGIFRTAVADWNPVPTGSMRPTIVEGDVVFVNRLAYDLKLPLTDVSLARLGEPERGDIVTFSSPKDGTRLIKRLVAVPGDVVEMRQGALLINGAVADYRDRTTVVEPVGPGLQVDAIRATEQLDGRDHAVQYFTRHPHGRSFGPVTVPAEAYFMLGDSRDNSEDSRFIGFVPRPLLVGRAERILVSFDMTAYGLPRLDRTVAPLR